MRRRLSRSHGVQRAHVVQAVGQLDQDDAYVARHGEEHLAIVLGLRFLIGLEFDAVELGNAIDQLGGGLAELRLDVGLGDVRVFHHVVEQAADQGLGIEVPLGEDFSHRQRMRDIRLATDAELAGVRLAGQRVGGFEAFEIFRFEVTCRLGAQAGEFNGFYEFARCGGITREPERAGRCLRSGNGAGLH